MEQLRKKKGFICDMDGVIYHGSELIPGVKDFVQWLYDNDKKFLFLTNNSTSTPLELKLKLKGMGLDVDEDHFYTSALATARFVSSQKHHASAYVIGQPGLIGALYNEGIAITEHDPDFVIVRLFDLHLKLTQDLRVKLTHPGDLALMPVTGFTSGNLR
jgi:NagD protein